MSERPVAILSPKGREIVRTSAILVAVGILVQMITLGWIHPAAFLTFAMVGAAMVGLGVLGFFWSRFV